MSEFFWAIVILAALSLPIYRAGRIWIDAGWQDLKLLRRLGWALVGAIAPSKYWWEARMRTLAADEQADLLARETAALGLLRADSLRCPLCDSEVPRAWVIASHGRPIVAPGPIQCPGCDFRLDACRHCAHFLPGLPQAPSLSLDRNDPTFGRCGQYKETRLVEQVCAPEVARQLKDRGLDQVRAPIPIVDSYVPLDYCTAFTPDRKRLQASGIRWPDARRAAILRIMFSTRLP